MGKKQNHLIYYSLFILGFITLGLLGCGEPQLDRVLITPEKKTMSIGESINLKAVGLSKKGEEIPNLIFQWSTNSEIGTVDGSGRFTATKAGKIIIRASTEGMTGTVEVIVKKPVIAEKEVQTQKEEPPEVLKITPPPKAVMIDNKGFNVRKKGPVKLKHKKHNEEYKIGCRECHHDYKDGKNVWTKKDPVKSCGSCHDSVKKQGKISKLKNAYHKNCKDCHQELIKQGKSESAPFKRCADCHLKKS